MVDQDFEEAVTLILILERIEMTITTKVDNNIINTETCYICHRNVILSIELQISFVLA